jgi:hypothetical protein
MTKAQAIRLYKDSGMEVAVHALTHPFLEQLSVNECTWEVIADRMNLEQEYDVIVRGMAYPYGTYSDQVVEILDNCGIAYSRTVEATHRFDIPKDWLRLPSTCHHNDPKLMELAHTLVETEWNRTPALFYLWGHSYEFEADNNWHVIEEFAEYIGGREEIWYATNIEIYEYVKAYESLVLSADSKMIYNPTLFTIWFNTMGKTYSIAPGETLAL